jgi:mitochondrial pyruvate carrier 2
MWTAQLIANECYSLAAVNFFLGIVGAIQVGRILMYQQSLKGTTATGEIKDMVKSEAATVKGIVKDPKGAAENVSATH